MNTATSISSLIGGAIVFVAAVVGLARAIFRQVSATDKNTAALGRLSGSVDALDRQATDHDKRLAAIEAARRP